jgi:hypothetical protein
MMNRGFAIALAGARSDSDKVWFIDAARFNRNKRFKSLWAVSIQLKMTPARKLCIFINYGNHDKKTGLRERNLAKS